jgi:hypothetical protein
VLPPSGVVGFVSSCMARGSGLEWHQGMGCFVPAMD